MAAASRSRHLKPLKVLYAGDSPAGGPANYLLGVLRFLRARVQHLAPAEILYPFCLKENFDVIILSDFSRDHVPASSQKAIVRQLARGTGLLMVGGWGSFSGPYGNWQGSEIEKLLPVSCRAGDDRINFSSGAMMIPKMKVPLLRSIAFQQLPVICGMNQVRPKRHSRVILAARKILVAGHPFQGKWSIKLDSKEYPLLVTGSEADKRVAAFSTDLAPHWCGGLVDWGKALKLPVTDHITIEVGKDYLQFVSNLIGWLSGK